MDYYKNINEFLSTFNRNGIICFTNGCFDLLHAGHVQYLKRAKDMCDYLIVGINSDDSVKRLKGDTRPIQNQEDRAFVLSELKCVDAVIIFEEDTPYSIIQKIRPDILVKGGDYSIDDIVGKDLVSKVVTIEMLKGRSSSDILNRILAAAMFNKELK